MSKLSDERLSQATSRASAKQELEYPPEEGRETRTRWTGCVSLPTPSVVKDVSSDANRLRGDPGSDVKQRTPSYPFSPSVPALKRCRSLFDCRLLHRGSGCMSTGAIGDKTTRIHPCYLIWETAPGWCCSRSTAQTRSRRAPGARAAGASEHPSTLTRPPGKARAAPKARAGTWRWAGRRRAGVVGTGARSASDDAKRQRCGRGCGCGAYRTPHYANAILSPLQTADRSLNSEVFICP